MHIGAEGIQRNRPLATLNVFYTSHIPPYCPVCRSGGDDTNAFQEGGSVLLYSAIIKGRDIFSFTFLNMRTGIFIKKLLFIISM